MQREKSPAYKILRASTRRLLRYVLSEIARNGGGRTIIHNDMLEMVGSRRIYLTGLYELHTVGLLDEETTDGVLRLVFAAERDVVQREEPVALDLLRLGVAGPEERGR